MRNDCPSCGTVYAVTPQDVGKRIVCKQCGAALIIAGDGFRLDSSVPASAAPKADATKSKSRPTAGESGTPQRKKKRAARMSAAR